MNLIKNKNINYIVESILLAIHIFNRNESYDDLILINCDEYNTTNQELISNYPDLHLFLNKIRKSARLEMTKFQKLEKIFKIYDNYPILIYMILYSNLEEKITNFSNFDFYDFCIKTFRDNFESLGFTFDNDFDIEFIDKINIFNDEQKYTLYKLTHNVDNLFDDFYSFISVLERIILKNKKIILNFYNKIVNDSLLSDLSGYSFYDEAINLSTKQNIKNIMYNFIIQSQQIFAFSLVDDNNQTKALFQLGLIPFVMKDKVKGYNNFQKTIKILSAISDETRYNILLFLSNKKLYSKEIADLLNLTTATISHHISKLLECGIIDSEVSGNKLYFQINNEKIVEIINSLKGLISNET